MIGKHGSQLCPTRIHPGHFYWAFSSPGLGSLFWPGRVSIPRVGQVARRRSPVAMWGRKRPYGVCHLLPERRVLGESSDMFSDCPFLRAHHFRPCPRSIPGPSSAALAKLLKLWESSSVLRRVGFICAAVGLLRRSSNSATCQS